MILRQYQYRIGCFRNRLRTASDESHHRSSDKIYRIFYSCSACKCHDFLDCSSNRYTNCHRMLYLGNNGYQFIYNRSLLIHSAPYVVDRLNVEYRNAALDRKSSRTYDLSCHFVNQNNLITCWIYFIQQSQSDFRIFSDYTLDCLNCLLICFFDSDNDFFCAYSLAYQVKCIHNLTRIFFQ